MPTGTPWPERVNMASTFLFRSFVPPPSWIWLVVLGFEPPRPRKPLGLNPLALMQHGGGQCPPVSFRAWMPPDLVGVMAARCTGFPSSWGNFWGNG